MYGFFGDAGALGETPLLAGAAAFGGSFNGFEGGRGGFAFEIAAQSALVNTATGSISVGALGGMTGAGVGPLSIQTRQSGSLGVVGVSQSQVPYSQEIAFRAPVPNVPEDFSQSPGEGWEKRGPNWWHEPSGNSLHPDPNHSPPEGPHYDWHQRGKGHQTIQLRRLGDLLQFFDAEVLDWFPIELLPME